MEIAMRLADVPRRGGPGREVTPLRNDAETQRKLAPILALIDRTRQMPDALYQSSRADLAIQIWSQREGMEDESPEETNEAINEMLDRFFLSPRMVGVMRARTERGS
jgi:hypothetical protein